MSLGKFHYPLSFQLLNLEDVNLYQTVRFPTFVWLVLLVCNTVWHLSIWADFWCQKNMAAMCVWYIDLPCDVLRVITTDDDEVYCSVFSEDKEKWEKITSGDQRTMVWIQTNSEMKVGSSGAYFAYVYNCAGRNREGACAVPTGDVSCLGKCQKDQPDAKTSVSLIHWLKPPYGDSPLVVWVRNN